MYGSRLSLESLGFVRVYSREQRMASIWNGFDFMSDQYVTDN